MHDHKEKSGDNILENLIDTISDAVPKQKPSRFFNEGTSVFDKSNDKLNKLFGRQKSVHRIFGGGKSADVLLWRNKKISSSVLIGGTLVWVFFEWLDYHFLSLMCFGLSIGMIVQFIWSNAASLFNGDSSRVPKLVLPKDFFVNFAVSIGEQVNGFLGFIQNVSCGKDLKQFAVVVLCLWATVIIGGLCNFLTLLYIGFVTVHIGPVLYEKYEDQVDDFISRVLELVNQQYRRVDKDLLSKIPKGSLKTRKND